MSDRERVIRLFQERKGEYISGEQLSEQLHVSRTAIWKHVQKLREQGYRFESSPRKGYRLVNEPERLSEAELLRACSDNPLVRRLHVYDSVSTTMEEAHRLVAAGAGHGTLVVAEEQQAGRGRRGRAWHSPAGKGIWMSLVITPPITLQFAAQITLLTAVALCRAVRRTARVDAGIKWPNDLLVSGKKISGILVESSGEDERVRYMVVGIGVNCNATGDDYPPELSSVAASLYMLSGTLVNRGELIASIMNELSALYELYIQQGFEPIRTLWDSLSITLGSKVRTADGVDGVAESINDHGALLIRTADGDVRKLYSGDAEQEQEQE